jgi:ribonuclease P protein component
MLDRSHRLTSGRTFATTIRRGRRAGRSTVVLHLAAPSSADTAEPRIGLVVGRTVGNAVTRNQVKRRLRHISRERIESLPDGSVLVVRALPDAAGATSSALGHDFDEALARLVGRESA